MKTEAEFTAAVGTEPLDDDMARVNCSSPGRIGHFRCGWCDEHELPRFVCSCLLFKHHSYLVNVWKCPYCEYLTNVVEDRREHLKVHKKRGDTP